MKAKTASEILKSSDVPDYVIMNQGKVIVAAMETYASQFQPTGVREEELEEIRQKAINEIIENNNGTWRNIAELAWDAAIKAKASAPLVSEWVKCEDAPLFTKDANDNWECTEAGNGEFWAAVPYNDNKRPDRKDLVWIQRCVVEDGTGLCVIGEDENTPAGWELEDVVYYIPIKLPPVPSNQ